MVNKKNNKLGLSVARKSIVVNKKLAKSLSRDSSVNGSILDSSVAKEINAQTVESTDDVGLQEPYVVDAVKHFYAQIDEESNSKELFDEDKVIFLNLEIGKIPKCPTKTFHLNLKHSVLPADADILLITHDLKNDEKNYEKNNEHFRAILDKHEVTCIKEITSMHQLKSQYMEYEMQDRLMSLYDMFVVDSSVDGYVRKTFGGMINKRNKLYGAVKMNVSNVKGAFEKVLHYGNLSIHPNGDNFAMVIGHSGMEQQHLVENIMAAASEFNEKLPGGLEYVRSMHLKTALGKPLPFYYSQLNFSQAKDPVAKVKKPAMRKAVHGELSTQMDEQVTVTAAGDVIVGRKSRKPNEGARPKRERKAPERLEMPSLPKTSKRSRKDARKESQESPVAEAEGAKKKEAKKKTGKKAKANAEVEGEMKVKASPPTPKKKTERVEKAKPVKPAKEGKKVADKNGQPEEESAPAAAKTKAMPKSRKQKQKENVSPVTTAKQVEAGVVESKPKAGKQKKAAEKMEDEPAKKKVSPKRKNGPSASSEIVEKKKSKKAAK